jgi:hypothetical protein
MPACAAIRIPTASRQRVYAPLSRDDLLESPRSATEVAVGPASHGTQSANRNDPFVSDRTQVILASASRSNAGFVLPFPPGWGGKAPVKRYLRCGCLRASLLTMRLSLTKTHIPCGLQRWRLAVSTADSPRVSPDRRLVRLTAKPAGRFVRFGSVALCGGCVEQLRTLLRRWRQPSSKPTHRRPTESSPGPSVRHCQRANSAERDGCARPHLPHLYHPIRNGGPRWPGALSAAIEGDSPRQLSRATARISVAPSDSAWRSAS